MEEEEGTISQTRMSEELWPSPLSHLTGYIVGSSTYIPTTELVLPAAAAAALLLCSVMAVMHNDDCSDE